MEGLSELIRHTMRSYRGSKREATVKNFARHATLLTKLQHGLCDTYTLRQHEKTDSQCGNIGRRDSNVNNNNTNSPPSIRQSRQNALCSRSRFLLTAMPISHQQPQRACNRFCPKSIDDARFYQSGLAKNHPTKQKLPIQLSSAQHSSVNSKTSSSLFKDGQNVTVKSIPRTIITEILFNTDDATFDEHVQNALSSRPRNPPQNAYITKASVTPPPLKIQM